MKPTELKPCPFCGGAADIAAISFGQQKYEYTPYCKNEKCLAFYIGYSSDSGLYKTKKKAIDAWNRRANNEQAD